MESLWDTENFSLFDLLEMYQIHAWATEQKLYACLCTFFYAQVHVCFQKCGTHSAEDMSRCVFRALLSLRVLMCVFPPALFGLSVTAVKHIPVWTAGRVHTLSINPPLRVHVLTCANVCLCVSMGRWVVDALFIATAIPLCHQYLICHTTCQRTMSEHPSFPSLLHAKVNFILLLTYLCIAHVLALYISNLWKVTYQWMLRLRA